MNKLLQLITDMENEISNSVRYDTMSGGTADRLNNLLKSLNSQIAEAEKEEKPKVKDCQSCEYIKGTSYHDLMWCRDCQQMNHYKMKDTPQPEQSSVPRQANKAV